MKIAVILGPFSIGPRPLDFWYNNIWDSSRGLTGTDLTTVMLSRELVLLGHDVSLFTVHAQENHKPQTWEGVKLFNLNECAVLNDSFDAFISINEPDVFRGLPSKPLKICWQFLNDFRYCQPGFDSYVDRWFGVCQQHVDYLKPTIPDIRKWGILGLGCTPEWYTDQRVPGRVIWCSSADRGLHWLLQEWPKIKRAVPYASLRIFYHFSFGNIENIEPDQSPAHAEFLKEMGQRVRYMKNSIERMKHLDVEHVGSVSRERMKKEFNEACVLGFPCDTVCFSEGFSVTTMEAHASFTVPIITDKDCLGSVYQDSGAIIIPSPIRDNISQFSDQVIRALVDQKFSNRIIDKCRVFAMQNSWSEIAQKMQNIIKEGKR